jgi:hypothetical protein
MEPIDEKLWETARCRARFRKHLFAYIVVCAFLWGIWFMSGSAGRYYNDHFISDVGFRYRHTPWPAWVMFWWGIGLAFSFVKAYLINTPGSIENEYRKLKQQQ